MIGQLQLVVTFGRYDIQVHVQHPNWTHREIKKTIWVSFENKHFAIRYRTKEPNYSHLPVEQQDLSRAVYGNVKEEILKDIPKLLGTRVITNLLYDIVTGKSVRAVLHFIN